MLKYFQQSGTHWQLNADVRRMVEFRQMNLGQPWPLMPRMDLILLRNVMIYFDVPVKKTILSQASRGCGPTVT